MTALLEAVVAALPSTTERALLRLHHELAQAGEAAPCQRQDHVDHWTSDSLSERRQAARECRACPIIAACRQYADAADEPHGVWGGRDRTDAPTEPAPTNGKATRPRPMRPTRRLILRHVADHPGTTPRQIADATGLTREAVKTAVRAMERDGQLHSTGCGGYTAHHPLTRTDSRA